MRLQFWIGMGVFSILVVLRTLDFNRHVAELKAILTDGPSNQSFKKENTGKSLLDE